MCRDGRDFHFVREPFRSSTIHFISFLSTVQNMISFVLYNLSFILYLFHSFLTVRRGREGEPPPHSFRTSFYLFAAVHVPRGLPNLPQTVFREGSSIFNRQFKCIKTKFSNSNSVMAAEITKN